MQFVAEEDRELVEADGPLADDEDRLPSAQTPLRMKRDADDERKAGWTWPFFSRASASTARFIAAGPAAA